MRTTRPAPADAPSAEPVPHVTDDAFAAEVLESATPVLVDFTAAWCPPCRAIRPTLERLAAERDDLRIVAVDVDTERRTAAAYGVLSMPTLMLFAGGAPTLTLVGARPYARLRRELDAALVA
jgi:thioredoxin 1